MSRPAWRRNQWVMAAAVFVVFTGFAFVLPFLTLFVRELGVADAGAAATWAGVLIGVAPLLAGLLAPVWGRWADRHGRKRVALLALGAESVLLLASAGVDNVWQLLLLRVGVGLFGSIAPLGMAMATAGSPQAETGRAVGMIQAAQILAAAVGPVVGGSLADAAGVRSAFLATAALCAAAFVLVGVAYQEPQPAVVKPGAGASFGPILRQAGVPALLTILFFVNFIGRSFTPILPLHLLELGVPQLRLAAATGALISIYSVAAAASASWLGRASRRFAPRRLLALSLAAGVVTVSPMAVLRDFPTFLAFAVMLGLASGGALTLCYTIGGLAAAGEQRATAFGLFSAAALFGGAVSPSVAGLLAHWRLRAIYPVNGGLFALLAVSVMLAPRWPPATSRTGE